MGNIFGKLEMRVIIIGPEGSGKTTAFYQLKIGQLVSAPPTLGFNAEKKETSKINYTIWDIGGNLKIRPLWRHYFQNTHGIILVVDSSDLDKMEEAREELHKLAKEDELKNAFILVFANKQDLQDAIPVAEVAARLDLNNLPTKEWFIQATCATSGDGLKEGLAHLSEALQRING